MVENIFSVLKDILAYPSRTVLHNFPITSSNVSDNIETKWSDQYSMQNLPYFEANSLWQLLFGQEVKQSLPICRNIFILNNQNIAKGTTDPGVDCFDQKFWFGRFG